MQAAKNPEHTARFADEQESRAPGEGAIHPTVTIDTEKGTSSTYAASELGVTHKAEVAAAERRLVRKQDMVLLPFAICLYLSAYLDRGNLGNARLQGLEEQVLRNSDTAYSIALSCFFITYILLSVPGTLLAKAYVPSKSIAAGALIWSIAASCQAAATNPAGLYVCRLFVGVGEALFGQAMAYYLSCWYRKKELAKRVGLFISAGSLAGAFGGLISFGVNHIKHSPIAQWRILFLIEGIPSLFLAICVFFFLPSRPDKTRFFNEEERTLAITRLNQDGVHEGASGIEWAGVRRCFKDWKTYAVSIIYSAMNLGLGSVGGFLPTIIKGLGYTNAKAQLFTVPPYVVALVFMLMITTFSDRYQTRGFPIAAVFAIGLTGWAILMGVPAHHATASQLHARYFGCIAVVTAGYSNIPLIIAFQAANTTSQSQRAASLGMLNAVGQCLSILASFLFPKNEGPQYHKGASVNIAFQAMGLVGALGMTAYYRWENKRRDKLEGGRPGPGARIDTSELHDLSPGFRYTP